MSEEYKVPDEVWVEVGRFPNGRTASEHALVLVAAGIDCQMASRGDGVAVLVAVWHAEAARRELAAYAEDNRQVAPPPMHRHPLADAVTGVLAYWCAMVFVYVAAEQSLFGVDWLAAGDGQAGLTVGGQWWRVVTALGLHGDLGHIASNLAAGSLFGLFLGEILGSGLAWLMILLSGAIGNAVNAWIEPASHTSIGASTAIFGAVGLLAVLAVKYRPRRGLRRWAPIAAGIMLLAFLGVEGKNIDVGAHISGFVSGCVLGAAILLAGQPPPTRWRSLAFAGTAAVIFAGAWVIALVEAG